MRIFQDPFSATAPNRRHSVTATTESLTVPWFLLSNLPREYRLGAGHSVDGSQAIQFKPGGARNGTKRWRRKEHRRFYSLDPFISLPPARPPSDDSCLMRTQSLLFAHDFNHRVNTYFPGGVFAYLSGTDSNNTAAFRKMCENEKARKGLGSTSKNLSCSTLSASPPGCSDGLRIRRVSAPADQPSTPGRSAHRESVWPFHRSARLHR